MRLGEGYRQAGEGVGRLHLTGAFLPGVLCCSQRTFSQERGHLSVICYPVFAVWTGGFGFSQECDVHQQERGGGRTGKVVRSVT
jgi:hypothetical protein